MEGRNKKEEEKIEILEKYMGRIEGEIEIILMENGGVYI